MGLGLKLLSIISGSDEKTILNARAELINNNGTSSNISTRTEKEYILNTIAKEVRTKPKYIKLTKQGVNNWDLVCMVIDDKMQSNDAKDLAIMKRVLVQYYGYRDNNSQSRQQFSKFIDDVVYILNNPYY